MSSKLEYKLDILGIFFLREGEPYKAFFERFQSFEVSKKILKQANIFYCGHEIQQCESNTLREIIYSILYSERLLSENWSDFTNLSRIRNSVDYGNFIPLLFWSEFDRKLN